MDKTEKLGRDGFCRDGAFVVIFCQKKNTLHFLLGKRRDDKLWELLGGGFDIQDLTPKEAAVREVAEEAENLIIPLDQNTVFFAHMIQRLLPPFGQNEMGHVFYFYKELNESYFNVSFEASEETTEVKWHTLKEIMLLGESTYRTSTLRTIFRFMRYQEEKEFQFGRLKDKVSFREKTF